MPDDIRQNITIGTAGGPEAAAMMERLSGGLRGMGNASEEMQTRFAHKFEHAGLHVFNAQLLETVGITGHARPILQALTFSMTEAAAAAGLAAGTLGLIIGVVGLAAAAFKLMHDSHEKHKEDLEKTVKAETDVLNTTANLINTLDAYKQAVKTMAPELAALMRATQDLDAVQREHLTHTEGLALANSQKKLLANKDEIASLEQSKREAEAKMLVLGKETAIYSENAAYVKTYEKSIRDLKDADVVLEQETRRLQADIKAQGEGYSDAATKAKTLAEAAKANAVAQKEYADFIAHGFKEQQAAETEYEKFHQKMVNEASTATDTSVSKHINTKRRELDTEFDMERQHLERSALTFNQYNNAIEQLDRDQARVHEALAEEKARVDASHLTHLATATKTAFDAANLAVSTAIGAMIVEGKSWHDAFVNFTKSIETAFISMVSQMLVKWAVFQAITGFGGAGSIPFASAFTGFKPRALGGEDIVDRPTLFLAGDAGPERVNFTPMSGTAAPNTPSKSSARGGDTFQFGDIHIHGLTDPRAIADKLGNEIMRMVRGRGQLGFVRGT